MPRRLSRTLPSLAAILIATVLPATASATFPGADGRIAFARDGDIWTINPDGTGEKRLTADLAFESTPAWSPDGRRIAFTRSTPAGEAIYTVAAAGGPATRVTNGFQPAWSPDGRALAFVRQAGEAGDLRVIRLDGTRDRLVKAGGLLTGIPYTPDWSPRGTEIVFQFPNFVFDAPGDLRRIDIDGTDERPVAGLPPQRFVGDTFVDPGWAPYAQRIVYSRSHSGDNGCVEDPLDIDCLEYDIAMVNSDGTGDRRVLAALGSDETDPAFSPSGRRIAFISDMGGGGDHLWVMAGNGTGLRRVTTTPGAGQPSWQSRSG